MLRLVLFLLVCFCFTSCQDVIEIDLPESDLFLVVDGTINDSTGTSLVLSTSAGYFEQGETPKINTAEIVLYEDDSPVGTLERVDTAEGRYHSPIRGEVGKTYHIEITIPSDEPNFRESTWRSTPSTMPRIFTIDSLRPRVLSRTTNPQAFREGVYAVVYFQEPAGAGDRYRLTRWLNDSLFRQNISLMPDIGIDGQYIGDQDGIGGLQVYGPMEEGDTLQIQISSLARDHYRYLDLLNEQVFRVGSPFDPPPAPLYGNIYNVDNEEELGFGYFGASAVAAAQTFY